MNNVKTYFLSLIFVTSFNSLLYSAGFDIVFDPQNLQQAKDSALLLAGQLKNGETMINNIGDPSKRSEVLFFLASNAYDCGFRKIKLPGQIEFPNIDMSRICSTYDNISNDRAVEKIRSFFDTLGSDEEREAKLSLIMGMKKRIASESIAYNRAYITRLSEKPEAQTNAKLLERIQTSESMQDTLRIIAGLLVNQLAEQEQLNVMFANYANYYYLDRTEPIAKGNKEKEGSK